MSTYWAKQDLLSIHINKWNGNCFVVYYDFDSHIDVMRSVKRELDERGFWERFEGERYAFEGCDDATKSRNRFGGLPERRARIAR